MCNLYNLKVERWEINEHFRAVDDARDQISMEKDYVAPGKPGLVIRDEGGERLTSTMAWGFPHQGRPVTNVRNYTSAFWRFRIPPAAV